ncbi:MAG TPA: lipoprotein insertase outer membrane protein LolB [Pseudomonadales bacterium]|nr:lipoprotein insertase outer membrane protein LolB [Pseudomonadales bacterium]
MRRFALVIVILLLTACAQRPIQPNVPNTVDARKWSQHARALEEITHWQLQGRIGIRSPDRALSASIVWQQHQESFDIRLSGPFGQGALQLNGDPAHLTLRRGQENITSDRPQQQLNQELGTFLPLNQARYWAIGHPGQVQTMQHARFDGEGRLESFEAEGWQISYQDYRPIQTLELPHKIVLQNEDNKITLVVNSWKVD